MPAIHIAQVNDDAMVADWQRVHNTIIPTAVLSLDEVKERSRRNHLTLGYLDGLVVGCATVRQPVDAEATATVIARVLPAHRRQGFGAELYEDGLRVARSLGAQVIETIILESNLDGLRFALVQGFVEVERYLLPGDTVRFITLRLP